MCVWVHVCVCACACVHSVLACVYVCVCVCMRVVWCVVWCGVWCGVCVLYYIYVHILSNTSVQCTVNITPFIQTPKTRTLSLLNSLGKYTSKAI